VATINTELALADLDTVERAAQRADKAAKAMDKDAIRWRDTLKRMRAWLDEGRPVRAMPLDEFDRERLRELSLLTAKQVLYVANVDEGGFSDNPRLEALEKLAASEGSAVVAVCAAIEAEISELDEADRAAFLADLGLAEAGLDRIIRASYRLLGLLTFFTAGPKEVRAWTVRASSTAPQAAGVIHTDFERGFIRAETIAFDDYVRYKGEAGAREAGKLRLEGKDYLVREADVMHFRFNV
jgi:ribosome-binding ATPase